MDQIHQIGMATRHPQQVPSTHHINLRALAGVATALAAGGRDDLAANIVEILYYCADQRTWRNNVVPFRKAEAGGT